MWYSLWHDGDKTKGISGDVGPIPAAVMALFERASMAMGATFGGVFRENNEIDGFVLTGEASPLSLSSGAGIVNGRLVVSTAPAGIVVATPTTLMRKDRVVLRYLQSTNQVRAALLPGVEGSDYPVLTETSTCWEVPLWKVEVTTGGVFTLTDERAFIPPDVAKTELIQITDGWNATDDIPLTSALGYRQMANGKATWVQGFWQVPTNYVSGLNIGALVESAAAGNAILELKIYHGVDGEAWNEIADASGEQPVAITADIQQVVLTTGLTIRAPIAGEFLRIALLRDATNPSDTVEATFCAFGFKASYYQNSQG